ncbi:MAG TPA: ABC transporter permease [Steroidobacteraceae bacterium]|nr:ABC transporter permease [Steroidobacteraceae bacterium]HRX87990.1 ABC transporter permease [Steroidobacteraceae bacterium]
MTALASKLRRELWQLRGQMFSIALVVATGIMTVVTMRGSYETLIEAQQSYYRDMRFADVWVLLKRAPDSVRREIEAIPGVAAVDTRVTFYATLALEGLDAPAQGRFVSLPQHGRPIVNDIRLRSGRYLVSGAADEVILSENFAVARGLRPGDKIRAVINGRARDLDIVGTAISPEHTYAVPPGSLYPDDKRYGILWMSREVLGPAYDMDGAFNEAMIRVSPEANEEAVIARLDTLLDRYAGLGAYSRADQPSHLILQGELDQNRVMGTALPAVFLAVAAFLLNLVLGRLIRTQRSEIAVLKAFGYRDHEVGQHYLLFALAAVVLGAVIGAAAGVWLGQAYIDLYGEYFDFPNLQYRLSLPLLALAVVVSLVAAVAGAITAVRQAIALPPAEAMRPEAPARFHAGWLERHGLTAWLSSAARMILRNLERKPVQSLLSSLGVAFSVAILVIGLFMFDGVKYMMDLQFRVIQREDLLLTFDEPLDAAIERNLQHLDGVTRVESFRAVPARLNAGQLDREVSIVGMAPDGKLRRIVAASGRVQPLPLEGVVLSRILAAKLKVTIGGTLYVEILEGRRRTGVVQVVGVVDDFLGMSVYMNQQALQRLVGGPRMVSGAYLSVAADARRALERELKNLPAVAGVASPSSMLESFQQQLGDSLFVGVGFLLGFASVIAIGVIYNGARISLAERGRELASLRVMGFRRRETVVLLLGEQAVVTVLAIPLGWLLGYGLSLAVVSSLQTETYRIPFVISSVTYLIAASIAILAAIISGAIVKRRVDGLDLIAVLKTRE